MASLLDEFLNTISQTIFAGGRTVNDAVVLKLDGKIYHGWNSVSVTKNIDSVANGFQINVSDRWREDRANWPFKPNTPTRIFLGDKPVVNGYIDRLDVSIDQNDRSINFSGRSKTGDIVDCSVTDFSEAKNQTLLQIASTLCEPFGISVLNNSNEGLLTIIPVVRVQQGETVFELLNRLAVQVGVVLLPDANGNLVITNRSSGVSNALSSVSNPLLQNLKSSAGFGQTQLKQGLNILSASASFDNAERFSEYKIKGQKPSDDFFSNKQVTEVLGTATDEGVARFRPNVIMAENSVDDSQAKQRAGWECSTRAARSVDINIIVQGWTDINGELYDVNKLYDVDVRFLGIKPQKLLCSSVTFNKSDAGTFTALKLTRGDAYAANPTLRQSDDVTNDLGWDFEAILNRQAAERSVSGR